MAPSTSSGCTDSAPSHIQAPSTSAVIQPAKECTKPGKALNQKHVSWASVLTSNLQSSPFPPISVSPKAATFYDNNCPTTPKHQAVILHSLTHRASIVWTKVSYKKFSKAKKSYLSSSRCVFHRRQCAWCLAWGHMAHSCRDPIRCLECNDIGHRAINCHRRREREAYRYPSPPMRQSPPTVLHCGSPLLASSSYRPPPPVPPKPSSSQLKKDSASSSSKKPINPRHELRYEQTPGQVESHHHHNHRHQDSRTAEDHHHQQPPGQVVSHHHKDRYHHSDSRTSMYHHHHYPPRSKSQRASRSRSRERTQSDHRPVPPPSKSHRASRSRSRELAD